MHVMVTGGAGFIGSHIVEFHLKKGDKVHVVDNLSTGVLDNIKPYLDSPDFHFTNDDILTMDHLARITTWADRIYHFAAIVGMFRVVKDPIGVLATNIAGTERLLRAIDDENWTPQVVMASTSEVYGHSPEPELAEDQVLHTLLPARACVGITP